MDGMIEKAQLSLRVPVDMITKFEQIAKLLDRDRSWVMLRALRQYLENEGADLTQESAAIESLDRGEAIEFDNVIAEANSIIATAKAGQARKSD